MHIVNSTMILRVWRRKWRHLLVFVVVTRVTDVLRLQVTVLAHIAACFFLGVIIRTVHRLAPSMLTVTLYVEKLARLAFVTLMTLSTVCLEKDFLFFCVSVVTLLAFDAAEFVLTVSGVFSPRFSGFRRRLDLCKTLWI